VGRLRPRRGAGADPAPDGGELARILAEPEVRARVEAQGMDVLATPGEGFAPFLDAEIERWGRVVRENGIRLEG
jgi:tripartite-type tricarboxylate transporter receptor subunit TctC